MRWGVPYHLHRSKWEPATSTINFCEEDFYITGYVAEVMNVTTNIIFLILAYKGIKDALQQKHSPIFILNFVGYAIIGIGSIMFHSTLKYPMQLVDELAMIYTTLIACFATFSYGHSTIFRSSIAASCITVGVTVTLVYHLLHKPIFHQVTFAVLMISLLLNSMYLMETRVRQRNIKALMLMWQMVGWGSAVFISAFVIWNLDNGFCGDLRKARRAIGMPWGFLLELHAWWHIGTGIGAYYLLIWGEFLRLCLDEREGDYCLIWPSLLSYPRLMLKKNTENWEEKGYICLTPDGGIRGGVLDEAAPLIKDGYATGVDVQETGFAGESGSGGLVGNLSGSENGGKGSVRKLSH